MLKLSKTSENKGSVLSELKIGYGADRLYIKYELSLLNSFGNMQTEYMRNFMKSIEIEVKKEKKSRAAELRERRKKQTLVQFIATPKAEENLKKLCENTGLNKTQVINKLLEEQEQLSLFK